METKPKSIVVQRGGHIGILWWPLNYWRRGHFAGLMLLWYVSYAVMSSNVIQHVFIETLAY